MLKIVLCLFIGLLLLTAYVKYIEGRGIYFPIKEVEFTPQMVNLAFEDVYFNTADGLRLNGWFLGQGASGYTVLFLHGNAGNIGHRLDKIVLLRNMPLKVFIIDYRGYGRSQGKISEKGAYRDAQAAYMYLVQKRKISPERIILYGESLGTAVAINLAAEKRTGALIIEGGFSRGRDMAKQLYPFLPAFLFANTYDSLSKIEKINAPKLFLHSESDEVVPFKLARRLYDRAREPKQMIKLKGGHNSLFIDDQERYTAAIKGFIQDLK